MLCPLPSKPRKPRKIHVTDSSGTMLHCDDGKPIFPFDAAVILIERAGLISEPHEAEPGAVTADSIQGWNWIARELSKLVTGQVWAGKSGITHMCGRTVNRLFDNALLGDIRQARAACLLLNIPDPGPGIGCCARAVLKFVGQKETHMDGCEHLIQGRKIGYHDCAPGVYEKCSQWDVSGYYFNLLKRLPSLRCCPSRTRIHWADMAPDDAARWRDVCEVVAGAKMLRNALWGCALGRGTGAGFWSRGVRKFAPPAPGPFRAAACVVGRSAWELCRESSEETDSVYSSTDSVITRWGVPPATWNRVGLTCKFEAGGTAEIVRSGCYKIGQKPNVAYDSGCRFRIPETRLEAPPRLVYKEWL